MRFSLVLNCGQLPVGDGAVTNDGRLYHFDLPRAAPLTARVSGTVQGHDIQVPVVDLLASLRAGHCDDDWSISAARAHLTGAYSGTYPDGRHFLDRVEQLIENDEFRDGSARVEPSPQGRVNKWVAYAPSQLSDGKVKSAFPERRTAEIWVQRRVFANRVGWSYKRLDDIFGGEDRAVTLDEMTDVAEALGEFPSQTLDVVEAV